jgi:hypothetical protein
MLMFGDLTVGSLYISFLYGVYNFVNKYLGHTEYIMNINDDNVLLEKFKKYCDENNLYEKYINVYCDGSKNSMVLISLCYNTFDNFTVIFNDIECFNKLKHYLYNYNINCDFSEEDNIMLSHLSCDQLYSSYLYDLIESNDTEYFKQSYNENYYYPFHNIKQFEINQFLNSHNIYYLNDKEYYDDDYFKIIMISRFCDIFLPAREEFLTEYYYTQKELGNIEDFEGLNKFKFGSYITIDSITFRQLNKLLSVCCEYEYIDINIKEQLYNIINNNNGNGKLNDNYFYYYTNNVLYIFNRSGLVEYFDNNLVVTNDMSVCSFEDFMNGEFTYKCVGEDICSLANETMIISNKYPSNVYKYMIDECCNIYDFPNYGDGVIVTTHKNNIKQEPQSLLGMFF